MFESKQYDPALWKEVVKNYSEGKKYIIKWWKWAGRGLDKEITKELECPTLEDFGREVWDIFADFTDKNEMQLVWGPFGLKNRNPYTAAQCYYDGLIFSLCKDEYLECIQNPEISRFYSLMHHFSYDLPIFEVL